MRQSIKRMAGLFSSGKRNKEDIHMGEPGFLNKLLRWKQLESVFLFVTAKCNSKCKTCFYAGKMDQGEDLSMAQLERISSTSPSFDKLWLSGGEPFMRKELVDIIAMFVENNGVRSINLPTNGLLTERIDEQVGELLRRCPELTVHLNFSMDGLGATHDAVRGVPGNFAKTLASMERVQKHHGENPKLLCNVATVVTPQALDEMVDLGAFLLQKNCIATHFFESIRGQPRDESLKPLSRAQLEELHERVMPLVEVQAQRLFAGFSPIARAIAHVYFLGVIRFAYSLQEKNIEGPNPWGMACTAGQTTLVIDHDGALRSCEIREPFAHLSDFDFDMGAVMKSEALRKEVEDIGGGHKANCWCTHTCWVLSSMKFSPKTLLFSVPLSFLNYRLEHWRAPVLPDVDMGEIEARAQQR